MIHNKRQILIIEIIAKGNDIYSNMLKIKCCDIGSYVNIDCIS